MAISTLSSASSCSRGALAQCLRARSDMVHSVTPRTSVLDLNTRSGWLTLPPEPSINRRLDLYVAALQHYSRPRHPISAFAVNQMGDDIERAPSVFTFILEGPRFR